MTIQEINNLLGSYDSRQQKTLELAGELKNFLSQNNYEIFGPSQIGENPQVLENKLKNNSTQIEFRAKTSEAILNKLQRFNESLEEMLDLYGLRLVVLDIATLEKVALEIKNNLWANPPEKEMTIRGGKMVFSSFRDYRKRDWEGASPLSAGGYDTAIHINRKTKYGLAEIQIMTAELYKKYYGNGDESHKEFKKRQAEYFKK